MKVKRRALLGGLPLLGVSRALAQPMPMPGPVGRRSYGAGPLRSLGGGPPGKTLDLSFMTPGTLPTGVTFIRGSIATYFDATGTMQTVSGNTPRWDYNPSTLVLNGLLIEESRTNAIRNSTMQGAVVGAPGTLPTNWTAPATGGLSWSVISFGNDSGIPYIDLRVSGTSTGAASFVTFEPTGNVTAANGQPWIESVYVKLQAGTLANLPSVALVTLEQPSGTQRALAFTPTAASLASQRYIWGFTTNQATTTSLQVTFKIAPVAGAIDATFRIGAPQIELGAFPTSFIPTASAAVTRSADVATIASIPGRNSAAESYQAEMLLLTAQETNSRIIGSATTAAAPLYATAARNAGINDTAASLVTANAFTLGNVAKLASTWASPNVANVCLNAGAVASAATLTAGFAGVTSFKLMGDSVATDQSNGYIRWMRYWPRALTNTELQQVTT